VTDVEVRPFEERDVPHVVRLLDAALGPAPGGADRRALVEWKHLRNPFGPSIALVAVLDGEIVGFRAFMRWTLLGPGGEEVAAARAVDTATSPAVRRRGIFSRLTREGLGVLADEGVRVVFNTPNARSRPGYLAMGWRVVTRWPVWIRARRPLALAGAAARRDLASGPAVAPPRGAPLTPVREVPAERAAGLAARMRPPGASLRTLRSPEYLRWRYADAPVPYHALVAEEGPRTALAIVRLRARGRLREAVVCEALCERGAEDLLARALRSVPRAGGADHAVAHAAEAGDVRAALRRAGYRRVPVVGVTFTARRVVGVEGPDPYDPASWALALGDLELF
jgi:predicted N-acetyltransferase YhbS